MIVDRQGSWLSLVLRYRGSVLPSIAPRVLVATGVAIFVSVVWPAWDLDRFSLTLAPFSLIGVALSIFLGFRNNTSYDRFWEGRKLWGRLVNASRTWARQVRTLVGPLDGDEGDELATLQRRLIERQIAYVHALRLHLRDRARDVATEATAGLDEGEPARLATSTNAPSALAHRTGLLVRAAYDAGRVHPMHLPVLEGTLTELLGIQGGCERIRATPIPFSYTVLTHRIVGLYCLALPFGVHDAAGDFTPAVVAMVAFAFYGLDAIGDQIEDPFGTDDNDLPLDYLSTMIEGNLREVLGDELPGLTQPKDGVLS